MARKKTERPIRGWCFFDTLRKGKPDYSPIYETEEEAIAAANALARRRRFCTTVTVCAVGDHIPASEVAALIRHATQVELHDGLLYRCLGFLETYGMVPFGEVAAPSTKELKTLRRHLARAVELFYDEIGTPRRIIRTRGVLVGGARG